MGSCRTPSISVVHGAICGPAMREEGWHGLPYDLAEVGVVFLPAAFTQDIPVSDQTITFVYVIAALIMVVVAILVIAWLASVVARLLEWSRGHRERRG